jgi:hypothetical protein
MNRIRITTGIILLALFSATMAQSSQLTSLAELSTFMNSDYNYIEEQRARNALIEGSPYLEEEFTGGSLLFRDTYYRDLLLRYNIYEGHFEFKSDDQVLYFDPRYTEVDTVWMGEDRFIFQEYQEGKNTKRSYMQLLYEGDTTQVLVLRETILLQPEKAAGYEDAKPARFQPRADRLFVRFSGSPALEFTGKKSIPDLFPSYINELTNFTRKERLRFRSSHDLVALCSYYEQIRKNGE